MILDGDGFAHYGADETLLTDGEYAEINQCTLETVAGYPCVTIDANVGRLRKVFRRATALDEGGIGYFFYVPSLPTDSDSLGLALFRDSANYTCISLVMTSTGQVAAWRDNVDDGVLLGESAPCFDTGAMQHFECNCIFDVSSGAIEVRVNGVTVLNLTGIDTLTHGVPITPSTAAPTQYALGKASGTSTGGVDISVASLFERDADGSFGNTFVGERRLLLNLADADTAVEEWVPSTGTSSFAMVDNVPPNDAQYLETDVVGDRTVLGIANLPATVVSIAAVIVKTRQWKSDAGVATTKVGLISNAVEEQGDDEAVTQAPTFYTTVFETDPNTSTLWTPAAFNAATFSIERTA